MKLNIFSMTTVMMCVVLTACEAKVAYMTPQIEGQVIDRRTSEPVSNVKVILTSKDFDVTDNDGKFLIPQIEYHYRVFPPKSYDYSDYSGAALIFIKDNYKDKSYTLGNLPSTNTAQDQESYNVDIKRYINMGKVYLTPADPNILEMQEEIISYTLDYCQPNQSQKEVECIPVPKAMTHKQVSPNQPSK